MTRLLAALVVGLALFDLGSVYLQQRERSRDAVSTDTDKDTDKDAAAARIGQAEVECPSGQPDTEALLGPGAEPARCQP